MALDFFGVYIAAKIVTIKPVGGQTEFDLWTSSTKNPLPPSLAALSNLGYVAEVQIEVGMAQNSRISLTLTPPFEDALEFINSPIIQWGVGRLHVKIGYTTGSGETISQEFEGLLQKPNVHIGSDITITLDALGVGYSLSTAAGADGRHFDAGTTWAETIEKILSEYKDLDKTHLWDDFNIKYGQAKGAQVNHSLFKPNLSEPVEDSNGNKVQQSMAIDVGPRNDWWYLHETCRDHATDIYVEGTKVMVRNRDKWLLDQPNNGTKRFVVRGGVDPKNGVYPVLDLSCSSAQQWIRHGSGEVVQKDVKADKSGETEARYDDKSAQPTRLGKGTINKEDTSSGKKANVAAVIGGNPDQSKAAAQGNGEFKSTAYKMGLTIEVDTIGIPGLLPGEVVEVSGTENSQGRGIFNGKYGIVQVTHSIGVGGYSSHYKAIGNFIPEIFQNAVSASGPTPSDTPNANSNTGSTPVVSGSSSTRVSVPTTEGAG